MRETNNRRLVLVLSAVVVCSVISGPAWATCEFARLIRSITPEGYSYVYTPGYSPGPASTSISTNLRGSFWAVGSGDPALGSGTDSGGFAAVVNDIPAYPGYYYGGWVQFGLGFGAVISTSWAASAEIDGCIDEVPAPRCLSVLLSDRDAAGLGYFALLTDEADPSANYDLIQPGNEPITLLKVPRPELLSTAFVGPMTFEILVGAPGTAALAAGQYTDAACPADVLAGYKIRSRSVPLNSQPPGDPDVALWDDRTPGGPIGLDQDRTITVSCTEPTDIYLVTSLVFESGYELDYVSEVSTRITCGQCTGVDADGDGFCGAPGTDCNDLDPDVFPNAPQLCDGVNNDCFHPNWPVLDGTTETDDDGDGLSECEGDCDDTNADVRPGGSPLCDGVNNDCSDPLWPALHGEEVDSDGDRVSVCGGDCDDGAATVFPGAPQLCDGLNNDCDDPNWPTVPPTEVDGDGDFNLACEDCDDAAATVFPGAPQICDGLNNDCDHPSWPALPLTNEFDDDGDGLSECQLDCDDTRFSVLPGAPQICDGLNNDCADPAWPGLANTNEADDDGDGTTECEGDCDDANAAILSGGLQLCDGLNNDCDHPNWPSLDGTNEGDPDGDDFSLCEGDCEPLDPVVYPGAPQICDGLNNDCDHPSWPQLNGTNELDRDADGFSGCDGDCAELEGSVYPGAPEVCDGLNNDCDHPVWPDPVGVESDDDLDGLAECEGDCDDTDSLVAPGLPELCDGKDNDCDDLIDEGENGEDDDGDNVSDACDNCPGVVNSTQIDTDGDGLGNSCDNCMVDVNPGQVDLDGDLAGDACDNCALDYNFFQYDYDEDGVGDVCDNCFFDPNPTQQDTDGDMEGDVCDLDDGLIYIVFHTPDFVDWQEEGHDSWNCYRGDLELLSSGQFTQDPDEGGVAGQECGLAEPYAQDLEPPQPGQVVFFLATGVTGGVEGDLGNDSTGDDRPNDNGCPQ